MSPLEMYLQLIENYAQKILDEIAEVRALIDSGNEFTLIRKD